MKNIAFVLFQLLLWVLFGAYLGLNPSVFVHFTALAFIVVAQLMFLWISQKMKSPLPFVVRLLKHQGTEEDQLVYDKLITVGFIQGMVGALMGFIKLLGNLSDGNKMGEAMAFLVLVLLYGSLQALFFLPSTKSFQAKNNFLFAALAVTFVFIAAVATFWGLSQKVS